MDRAPSKMDTQATMAAAMIDVYRHVTPDARLLEPEDRAVLIAALDSAKFDQIPQLTTEATKNITIRTDAVRLLVGIVLKIVSETATSSKQFKAIFNTCAFMMPYIKENVYRQALENTQNRLGSYN